MSGGIAVVFIYADLAFGFAKDNFEVIFVICMAAGFSERMIPDLFDKLNTSERKKPNP